ncbi:YbhB/YbcL family Raf kinase inhibitor-like protein [Agromyces sp. SYSU T00194]|uniref:YbhB/YbcL family Raf kinase inhibitor-like protein n=1 Tax=Agromyces chitinivorans TaxID=3158560 RepID=UPI003397AE66
MLDYDPYAALQGFAPLPSFDVRSDDIAPGGEIPLRNQAAGCGGDDVSPHLAWSGFPPETRGFVVTCLDPDAPTGAGWWHWAVNGLGMTTELPADAGAYGGAGLPDGAFMVCNEDREPAYAGPNPPDGTGLHRYMFLVTALDQERLHTKADETPSALAFQAYFHGIARGVLVGTVIAD